MRAKSRRLLEHGGCGPAAGIAHPGDSPSPRCTRRGSLPLTDSAWEAHSRSRARTKPAATLRQRPGDQEVVKMHWVYAESPKQLTQHTHSLRSACRHCPVMGHVGSSRVECCQVSYFCDCVSCNTTAVMRKDRTAALRGSRTPWHWQPYSATRHGTCYNLHPRALPTRHSEQGGARGSFQDPFRAFPRLPLLK